jgi:DNA repair exonuclease SbcCD ATPase subunit
MDIIFYFALIEYLYNYTKNSINLGVFIADETFDGLDNTSMMILLDILNIFKESTNIQIFMTSHNNSISTDFFDKTITVKKDEDLGISQIVI